MMQPIVSRISESTPTRPLSDESQRSETDLEPAGQLVLVPGDTGEAALPRHRHLAARVEVEVLSAGTRFFRFGMLAWSSSWVYPKRIQPADHPVGEADRVAADVLAELELVTHLAVVGVVVVDGLRVGRLDAGLSSNASSLG